MSNLFYELDHADTFSLMEGDGAAQTVELPGESQRRQTLRVSVISSGCGITKGLPGTLGRVQGVQSNAVEAGRERYEEDNSL